MVNPSVEVRLYDLDIKSYPELKEQFIQDLYSSRCDCNWSNDY